MAHSEVGRWKMCWWSLPRVEVLVKTISVAAILGPFHEAEWCMSDWELDS